MIGQVRPMATKFHFYNHKNINQQTEKDIETQTDTNGQTNN